MAGLDVSPITQLLNTMGNQRRAQEQRDALTGLIGQARSGDANALNQLQATNLQQYQQLTKDQSAQDKADAYEVGNQSYAIYQAPEDKQIQILTDMANQARADGDDEEFYELMNMVSADPNTRKAMLVENMGLASQYGWQPVTGSQGSRGRIIEGVDDNGDLAFFQDTPAGIQKVEGFTPSREVVGDINYQNWLKKQQEKGGLESKAIEETTEAEASKQKKIAESKSKATRQQGFIDSGIEAADALGNVTRSIQLLDLVETGGMDNVSLRAKQLFGVESADEAELSARLGKTVLSQLKPIFGAAFTAQEGAKLERIEAGFGKSTAGNRKLLNDVLKITERAARRGLAAAKASGDDFAAKEIQAALDDVKQIKVSLEQSKKSDKGRIAELEEKHGIK